MTTPKNKPLVEDAPEQAEETALANPEDGVVLPRGFQGTMESSDDLIPLDFYLKIGHALSSEVQSGERKAGDLYIPDHDSKESIILVPVGYQLKRTLWNEGLVDCRSWGGVMGEGEPGGYCQECPENQWVPVKGKNKKACQTSHSFQCWALEWERVVIFDLKSTAARLARQIKTWHDTEGGFGHFAFQVKTARKTNAQGSWHTPVLSLVPMTPEIAATLPRKVNAVGVAEDNEEGLPF